MAVNLSTIQVKRKDPWATLTRAVILGDSIDNLSKSYSVIGCYVAKVPLFKNSAVGGNTLEEMYNRFDTDVTPYEPDFVIVKGGTNDVGRVGYTRANSISFLNLIIEKCYSIGAVPVVVLPPARNGVYNAQSLDLRQYIKYECDSKNVDVFDPFKISIDPETGSYLSGWTTDDIHPTVDKDWIIGEEFGSQLLDSRLKFVQGNAPTENLQSGGINPNPLMYTANGYGGWAVGGPTSGATAWTASIIDDADFRGKAQKIVGSSSSVQNFVFKIGDKGVGTYFFTFKLKINGHTGGNANQLDIFLYDDIGNRNYALQNSLPNVGSVIVCSGFFNAINTNSINMFIDAGFAGAWTIDFSIGELQAWLV